MKRLFRSWHLLIALALLLSTANLHAQTKTPQLVRLFRDAVAKSKDSTVRVLSGGKEAALGTVVGADGWILTKHSELKGKITVRLSEDNEVDAELVGHDVPFDLALLKIDAKDLKPVEWTDSNASKIGHFVASTGAGEDAVAVGVISVAARTVKGTKFTPLSGSGGGYPGIALDLAFLGVKVQEVFDNGPAKKAGLKAGDLILSINGEAVQDTDEYRGLMAKNKVGDSITLKISRDDMEHDIKITLAQPPGSKGGKSRSDIQNNMGSKLSDRRGGFPVILQHDSVVRPQDCGGPLVNLDGQVIGINIARAGRVESYAIPSEAVRPLLAKLKMKKTDGK